MKQLHALKPWQNYQSTFDENADGDEIPESYIDYSSVLADINTAQKILDVFITKGNASEVGKNGSDSDEDVDDDDDDLVRMDIPSHSLTHSNNSPTRSHMRLPNF